MFEQFGPEPPQDYGDLVRLVTAIHELDVREPGRQAIRDQLLAKLNSVMENPGTIRGGWRERGGWWVEGAEGNH